MLESPRCNGIHLLLASPRCGEDILLLASPRCGEDILLLDPPGVVKAIQSCSLAWIYFFKVFHEDPRIEEVDNIVFKIFFKTQEDVKKLLEDFCLYEPWSQIMAHKFYVNSIIYKIMYK